METNSALTRKSGAPAVNDLMESRWRVAWRPALRACAPFVVDAFEATQERAFVHRAPTVAPLSQRLLCVRRV